MKRKIKVMSTTWHKLNDLLTSKVLVQQKIAEREANVVSGLLSLSQSDLNEMQELKDKLSEDIEAIIKAMEK